MGVAGQATAETEGVDGNAQGLELRPKGAGLALEAKQLHRQPLMLPVAGQLQGKLGAALGDEGGEDDEEGF